LFGQLAANSTLHHRETGSAGGAYRTRPWFWPARRNPRQCGTLTRRGGTTIQKECRPDPVTVPAEPHFLSGAVRATWWSISPSPFPRSETCTTVPRARHPTYRKSWW